MAISRQELQISNRVKERVALQIMYMIGECFYKHMPAWTMDKLSNKLNYPIDVIQLVVKNLEDGEIITKSDDDPPEYIPAQPLDTLLLKTILDTIRAADEDKYVNPDRLKPNKSVDLLFYDIDIALADALESKTLKDLVMSAENTIIKQN
jgi:membrane protein